MDIELLTCSKAALLLTLVGQSVQIALDKNDADDNNVKDDGQDDHDPGDDLPNSSAYNRRCSYSNSFRVSVTLPGSAVIVQVVVLSVEPAVGADRHGDRETDHLRRRQSASAAVFKQHLNLFPRLEPGQDWMDQRSVRLSKLTFSSCLEVMTMLQKWVEHVNGCFGLSNANL